jgi:hypothetical protein
VFQEMQLIGIGQKVHHVINHIKDLSAKIGEVLLVDHF